MNTNVTLNNEQKLYVIPEAGGFSCLGFANCFAEVEQLAIALGEDLPAEGDYGTLGLYARHGRLVQRYNLHPASQTTWFKKGTSDEVRGMLERLRVSRSRVRIFHGCTDKYHEDFGLPWFEEHDVIGTVSRTTGTLKVPMLVPEGAEYGNIIFDDAIVRVVDCSTGRDIYKMPGYREHSYVMRSSIEPGYYAEVLVEGHVHARFKKPGSAERWIAFMRGERFTK